MTTGTGHCASYLKQIFADAVKSNPQISLRAFAKKCGLSPGGLSLILNQKKKLSASRAHEIAQALRLSPKECDYFVLLAQMENAKNSGLKSSLYEKAKNFYPEQQSIHNLSLEQFRLISEWYGLAILEYITTISGEKTSTELAQYFGIQKIEVETTLDRLLKLEIIEKTAQGYKRTADRILVSSGVPNEAIRNYYQGVLEQSKKSITTQTPKQKIIGTEVFAFDVDQISQVTQLTDRYLNALLKIAKKGKNRKDVYQVFVDVFRLNEEVITKPSTSPSAKKGANV